MSAGVADAGPHERVECKRILMLERRQHVRYRVDEGILVVNGDQPGRIRDISMGGMAMTYVSRKSPTPLQREIDLVDSAGVLVLGRLPCQVVEDARIPSNSPFSQLKVRRRRLQFGAMSAEQRDGLRRLIAAHTVGRVSSPGYRPE